MTISVLNPDALTSTGQRTQASTSEIGPTGHALGERQFSTGSYDSVDINDFLFEDDDYEFSSYALFVYNIQTKVKRGWKNNRRRIRVWLLMLFIVLYIVYFGCAMNYKFHKGLLVLTVLFVAAVLLYYFSKHYGDSIHDKTSKQRVALTKHWRKWLKWVCLGLCVIAVLVFIAIDVKKNYYRLISLVGVFVYILLCWMTSIAPDKVSWHTVISGIVLQGIFGLVILRWESGFKAIEWFGNQAVTFLDYTNYGSDFVFGEYYGLNQNGPPSWAAHGFVMQALMSIAFFGACVNLLYYWGILQILIRAFGRVMQVLMGVGPIETLCAAANIFLGPNTSVLTIRSFVSDMTLSELHCIFTSGFASLAGSMLAVYKSFGILPAHLIAGSVMSAPAALSLSKLLYPETQKSKLDKVDKIKFEKSDERSTIDAFSFGATNAITIVASVMANIIAFVSILEFANRTVEWFGVRAGVEVTLEKITGWVFMPCAFLLGVEWEDCDEVGQMLGTKVFLSEVVGFLKLGEFTTRRTEGLPGPTISPRSEVITTYAMCGFSSFIDAGICLGVIGAIAPNRKSDMTKIIVRALVAGHMSCWISACIAGFLYEG